LKYPVLFEKENRKVFLEGEAFFDVTPDKKKIFLVKTSDITIKVFGTQFNVKSYPEENKVTTTLVEGLVAIETGDKNKPDTYLKPNQTATFFKSKSVEFTESKSLIKTESNNSGKPSSNGLVVANEADPAPVISWKDKRWVIDSEELGQLAVVFERRYNVKISFADSTLKKSTFTGTLTDETFEQVLKIIQLSAPVRFDVKHNIVTIKREN
jgi:ferric-dicitrate binding protein FerR (iron transport regulator)